MKPLLGKDKNNTGEDCDKKEQQASNPQAENSTRMSSEANSGEEVSATTPKTEPSVIDLTKILHEIKKDKKLFAIVLPIVFILSCLHIYNVPRYYSSDVLLAPEIENSSIGGGLSSLASSFGFDLSDMETTDAITPLLYPDLMNDNKFVVSLFKIQVTSFDDAIHTDYYSYLTKYAGKPWSAPIKNWFTNLLAPKKKNEKIVANNDGNNPYILTKKEDSIVKEVRDDINIDVDKKTGVISISAKAQDPLICKMLADSVTKRLQDFITEYRTSKAQKDVNYYKSLTDEAQASYEEVRRKYAAVSDANTDIVLASVQSEIEDIENDMQLKYNQYTQYQAQYQASIAKLRERTPAFTTLKGANVPIKPSEPKRMFFILGMCFFATFIICVYSTRKLIFKS